MFLGEFTHSLDSKARLMIPAKYREELAPTLVITRNPTEPCLLMFPLNRWIAFADQIDGQSMIEPKVALLRRMMFSAAEDLKIDSQGRILISQRLRDYAKIDNDMVLTGMYTYVELWNPTLWEEKVINRFGDINAELFSALNL